jgi:hypothetical protein
MEGTRTLLYNGMLTADNPPGSSEFSGLITNMITGSISNMFEGIAIAYAKGIEIQANNEVGIAGNSINGWKAATVLNATGQVIQLGIPTVESLLGVGSDNNNDSNTNTNN